MPKKAAKAAKAAAAHAIPTPTNPAAAAALAAAGAELKDLEGKRQGLVEELRVVEKQVRERELGGRGELGLAGGADSTSLLRTWTQPGVPLTFFLSLAHLRSTTWRPGTSPPPTRRATP